jgi:hypothetical protein
MIKNTLVDGIDNMIKGMSSNQFYNYCKVVSPNTSHLEAHAGFFRLLVKGIFNPYELQPFYKKLIS